ncbi:MAG: hypothetical protein R6W73_07745 [Candidatus Saliniplasma sp.]
MREEEVEDRAPVEIVRIIALLLPLLLKILLVYLRYKRKIKRKEKYLRKELKKAGMEKHHIEEICEDIQSLSLKDLMSTAGNQGVLKGLFP